jgi:hypothetical protein
MTMRDEEDDEETDEKQLEFQDFDASGVDFNFRR